MRKPSLYYTPPSDEQFNELKEKAIELWHEIDQDEEYGYSISKIERIKDIDNTKDNFMYMVAMFDHLNQEKLAKKLSPATCLEIRNRVIDAGYPGYLIVF